MLLPVVLASCASGGNAMWQTLRSAWSGRIDASQGNLNPSFRYLRLVVEGQTVLLALGYTDAHPQGPIEVWYSANKEVLRIQNGRIVGAAGTVTEWRSVQATFLPNWSSVAKASIPLRWTRTRDVMPGYRYGVKDIVITRAVTPPVRSQLIGLDPASLAWFEEESTGLYKVKDKVDELPVARYAVALSQGAEVVMYSEQCLATDLCFSMQRWPVPSSAGITR